MIDAVKSREIGGTRDTKPIINPEKKEVLMIGPELALGSDAWKWKRLHCLKKLMFAIWGFCW